MIADLIETKDLAETVVASLVAGIGLAVIFSVAIWGAARFVELSRGERPLAAGGAAILAAVALALTLACVALGIVLMTRK